jgi:hypothetical protein
MTLYEYVPHPHIERRKAAGPVRVRDQHPTDSAFERFNTRLGLKITVMVGTMVAAYVFSLIALISLPSAIKSGNLTIIVAWVSSNFIQLVLLPIIIVGQNVQAKAADKRSEQTYKDAEAVLAEAIKIQEHLAAQDQALLKHQEDLERQASVLNQLSQALAATKLAFKEGT